MVRWLRWHCPPDTGFEIRSLAVWGRARYLSVTEAPHNTNFHTWMGKKQFCFFTCLRRDHDYCIFLRKWAISWEYLFLFSFCHDSKRDAFENWLFPSKIWFFHYCLDWIHYIQSSLCDFPFKSKMRLGGDGESLSSSESDGRQSIRNGDQCKNRALLGDFCQHDQPPGVQHGRNIPH